MVLRKLQFLSIEIQGEGFEFEAKKGQVFQRVIADAGEIWLDVSYESCTRPHPAVSGCFTCFA